jgi:hypothetical protein
MEGGQPVWMERASSTSCGDGCDVNVCREMQNVLREDERCG